MLSLISWKQNIYLVEITFLEKKKPGLLDDHEQKQLWEMFIYIDGKINKPNLELCNEHLNSNILQYKPPADKLHHINTQNWQLQKPMQILKVCPGLGQANNMAVLNRLMWCGLNLSLTLNMRQVWSNQIIYKNKYTEFIN